MKIKCLLIFSIFVITNLLTQAALFGDSTSSPHASPETMTIDLVNNTYSGLIPGVSFSAAPSGGKTVLKINMLNYTAARFDVKYGNTPTGWTVDIGDSQSNNGWGGDGGNQGNDAEMQILNQQFTLYGSDYSPGGVRQLVNIPGFVQQGETLTFVARNEYAEWNDNAGEKGKLCAPHLYALDGQPDNEGPVNYDIYAAFNRVISSTSRSGSGVTEVTVTLYKNDYTLTVQSSPETGVPISYSPMDNCDDSTQTAGTNFTRTYFPNTTVTLTAPETHNGKNFAKWQWGNSESTDRTLQLNMTGDLTAVAIYEAPVIATYTLTVQSSPGNGVPIAVSPNDNNDEGDGGTKFTRIYDSGTIVTLTAPSSYDNKNFSKWLIDGVGNSNRTINVTMNQNHTVKAVYQYKNYILNVQSSPYPAVGITVTPTDKNGDGGGDTDFTRTYKYGTTVTLTAPLSFSGCNFIKWTLDGEDNTNSTVQVTMEGDLTAVAYYERSTPPEISVSRKSLNLGYIMGSSNMPGERFTIFNSGGGTLNWNVSTEMPGINLDPTSGVNCGTVQVTLDTDKLTAGKFEGTVYVSDPSASNSPVEVEIKLWIKTQEEASPPFGEFSTPLDNSTVYSSIPVTGWVLGDTGVESVTIYREQGANLVYIGDANFVEGARPDVEAAYPDYPMNYKAGWGYMMLTNVLPNGGNGTYRIHAIATNNEGRQTTLGIKTITVDNANAVKPFGAIETPTQGGAASGNGFINWGWVLTPQPNRIPTDGSTIDVIVDGVNIGHPVYNLYRSDIANLFPGYANSDGAVGYFYLDTTAYENGVHTIQWTATDSGGNTDGIGSRYFMIDNMGECTGSRAQQSNAQISSFIHLPVDDCRPVMFTKGFTPNTEPQIVYPDENGTLIIESQELQRLEIHFPQGQITHLTPLPIGSTLDREQGIFYWLPGPGFVGEYRFVFVNGDSNGNTRRQPVTIRILPLNSR